MTQLNDAPLSSSGTRTFDRAPGIAARFADAVARDPGAIALCCGTRRMTYGELDRRSSQLAHHLLRHGVDGETLVGICMERSIETIVAMLAVVKSGAAYLPLDLIYPRDRLGFILQASQAPVVLTLSGNLDDVPPGDARRICLDTDWERIATEPDHAPDIAFDADSLAYVMYTSGSTGTPKGCQLTKGNLARFFSAMDELYEFRSDDVWTFFLSSAFDVSGFEIWGALTHGARLVVVPFVTSRTPQAFRQLLIDEQVTIINLTPTGFLQLMQADEQHAQPGTYALRYVVLAGEALEMQSLRPWFERYGDQRPRIINQYGPTETTIFVTFREVSWKDLENRAGSMIGAGMPDVPLYLLDEQLRPVADGDTGELYVGGAAVARGYHKRPDLTAERFIDWRHPDSANAATRRLYRTGDLARVDANGDIEYLGRIDSQVKIRGFRIELGEIEATLTRHADVRACVVVVREDRPGDKRLVAYVVPAGRAPTVPAMRAHLAAALPDYMVPAAFVLMPELPQNENGKLDRKALPAPDRSRPALSVEYAEAADATERELCDAFADLLGIDGVGRDDNFFELGGNSLLATRLLEGIRQRRGAASGQDAAAIPITLLFRHPTPAALAAELRGDRADGIATQRLSGAHRRGDAQRIDNEPIAIIAMSGRFPGAGDVETFWRNLCDGIDSITHFRPDELDPAIGAAERNDPSYVPARGVIAGVEQFDAAFFGVSPREAEVMDPQQRVFLELAWECLERAGHVPDATTVPVGVFAGMYTGTYLHQHVLPRPDVMERTGAFQTIFLNDKDYIATRVAHKLNLTGPAINVQTACSTSLVAVCQAVDSLRAGHCDMALAGGAAVTCPPRSGYVYQEGGMLSPDGHTRTFDANAQGTVFCDGAVAILLKRLSDALADGDPVHAVIRGGAVNNDGGAKASFTAPSSDGQAAVIAMAHRNAGVEPRSIGYVEAHGTATPMGDPIEVEGLTKAFRRGTDDVGFCRIGSVKSNIGHLVIAAGGTGLVKAALSLREERIPATLHYERANPAIDFAASPFIVNDRMSAWPKQDAPRRAGVSSFGVGGTNAHVVLEEAPAREASDDAVGPQLLVLSARTPAALGAAAMRLADHLEANTDENLADVAYTLAAGRKAFAHRLSIVADDAAGAIDALRSADTQAEATRSRPARAGEVVFMFPGQGATYPGMGRGLYETEATFRDAIDECARLLRDELGFDLRDRLFSDDAESLLPTSVMQPATFAIEYALARLWLHRGVAPSVMIGHSIGEFVAATLAGVFELADALRLVARRGALMQAQPPGAMLSIRLPASTVQARLPESLSMAAENSPLACVVAGASEDIAAFQAQVEGEGIACRALRTSHAFHSAMMQPVVEPFRAEVAAVRMNAPALPIVSTVTGELLDAATATSPDYWARHLREPVRFATALQSLLDAPSRVLLEVGPRATLNALVRQQPLLQQHRIATVATLSDRPESECRDALAAVGRLWSAGVALDIADFDRRERRRRVCLPTYPFQRQRYWIEAVAAASNVIPHPAVAATTRTPTVVETVMPQSAMPQALAAAPSAAPAAASGRRDRLVGQLRSLFEDVAGFDVGEADTGAHFLELGLDSLVLTQVAVQLQKTFGVPVNFRQLMGDCSSLERLSAHLDDALPPEAAPAPAPAVAPVATQPAPAAVATPVFAVAPALDGGNDFARQLIAQQMQLMAQQLALLSGGAVVQPAPAAAAAPALSPAPQPAAVAAPAPGTPAATPAPAASPDEEDSGAAQTRYDVKKAFGAIARIDNAQFELSPQQKSRFDAFVQRYTARTRKSKDYTQEHRDHLADPRVVNGFRPLTKEIVYQIVVERSKGSRVVDIDGNEYIDATNGFGMSLFGWQPDFVLDAVREQLDKGYEIGPQHPIAGEVAKLVCELTGHERAALCNTGSEAVLGALRIARTVTARNTLVLFTGSYHGIVDEVIVRGTKSLRALPAAPGILRNTAEHVLVLDYGTPESMQIIRERAHEIAAVLVEPVQSRRLDFRPVEFLKELREVTRDNGALLIFDEVVTGFRASPGGVQSIFGIQADIATYGKVVGGGFPIGVIAGKREYMDALDGGQWQYGDDSVPTVGVTYFAGTFVRHPLALAAAKAVLEHFKRDNGELQKRLTAKTEAMVADINAFCADVGAPVSVKQYASVWKTHFHENHPLQDLLFALLRSRGIHILDNFPCFITTAHSDEDIARIAAAYKESVAEMQDMEFLPRHAATPRTVMDASKPVVPGARLGREPDGTPAWFVPNPEQPGKYMKVSA